MNRKLRILLGLTGIVQLLIALGFILQIRVVTQLWPLSYTNATAYTFIGSILAAAAVSVLWCVYSGETGAIAGMALDYITIMIPTGVLALTMSADNGSTALRNFGLLCGVGVVTGIALFVWSVRVPIRDPRPMPRLVRLSFAGFVVALVVVGGALVLGARNVLPWNAPNSALIIYGWMFIGAAGYFAYGLLRPSWHNAAGQLAGFLAYDVVLIGPFLASLSTISPALRTSLLIYTGAVIYSGVLAIYYLFIHRETRLVGGQHR